MSRLCSSSVLRSCKMMDLYLLIIACFILFSFCRLFVLLFVCLFHCCWIHVSKFNSLIPFRNITVLWWSAVQLFSRYLKIYKVCFRCYFHYYIVIDYIILFTSLLLLLLLLLILIFLYFYDHNGFATHS